MQFQLHRVKHTLKTIWMHCFMCQTYHTICAALAASKTHLHAIRHNIGLMASCLFVLHQLSSLGKRSASHLRRVFSKLCRNSCWWENLSLMAFSVVLLMKMASAQLILKAAATRYFWTFLLLKIASAKCLTATHYCLFHRSDRQSCLTQSTCITRQRTSQALYNLFLSSAACKQVLHNSKDNRKEGVMTQTIIICRCTKQLRY